MKASDLRMGNLVTQDSELINGVLQFKQYIDLIVVKLH